MATGLAGFFGTPALGAVVGAAMGGLDREGKSGIGFSPKQGLRGAVSGYGMGKLGSMASGTAPGQKLGGNALNQYGSKSGLGRLLGDGGARIAPKVAALGSGAGAGVRMPGSLSGDLATPAGGITGSVGPNSLAIGAGGGSAGGSSLSKLGGLGASIKANPQAYAMGLQGLGQLSMSGAANKQADAESRLSEARAAELEYENEQKRKREASLEQLRQMLGQSMPNFGSGAPTSPWNR